MSERRIRLRPDVKIRLNDRGDILFIGSKMHKLVRPGPEIHAMIQAIAVGASEAHLQRMAPDAQVNQLMRELKNQQLLRPDVPNEFVGTRYERQVGYFSIFQDDSNRLQRRLNDCAVVLAGLGGSGSSVVNFLLGAGVKRYIVIDDDRVQLSNLNRQFCYREADIGLWKTDVVAAYIRDRVPEAEIRQFKLRIDQDDSLLEMLTSIERVDFIFCMADQPFLTVQRSVVLASIERSAACTFGGAACRFGAYGPLLADLSAKRRYLQVVSRAADQLRYDAPSPVIGAEQSLVAAMMTMDVIHYLIGERDLPSLNRVVFLDMVNLRVKRTPI